MPKLTSVPPQVNLGSGSIGRRSNVNLGADRTPLTCARYRTEGRTAPRRDGGKTTHYMLRWGATTGEKGPPALDGPLRTKSAAAQRRGLGACQGWSETASAMIGA